MSRVVLALAGLLLLLPPAQGEAADSLGDEARRAGKPLIVDFGMTRCRQCIEQGKTMEELKSVLADRVLLKFVHVGREDAVAEAHKVLLIPTLVFFDAAGNEVFRNVGQMGKEPMLAKARELGLIE